MSGNTFDIHTVTEIRCKSNIYFGCGAISKINDIADQLVQKKITSVLVITGKRAYKSTGAWDVIEPALSSRGITYAIYDKVTPNPTTTQIDESVALGKSVKAGAVIAIGGGSPIDTGKSAAILLACPEYNAAELYEMKFTPASAVPIVAVNLTHGTGTEADRFAVATILEKEYKPAIAYDCIYPTWSIDDPALMTGLSPEQTRYVSIDAVNHCVEAATSKAASPFSISLAREAIALVVKYLPAAEKDPADLEARFYLLYASMLAGISFDNGLLHYTHALEHPLSGVKPDLTHGLGLAMLLPGVIKSIYAVKGGILADILAPIIPGLKGTADEALTCARAVEKWLAASGAPQKLADEGFTEKDIDRLVELAFTTPSLGGLLSLAPNTADKEAVRAIYTDSMHTL
ncbi:MAG: iron-containing alcohol dehydrogenase [Lentisphaeria bacterium]|nr:iron-containing alcohol dehydrogenase [Lentisphaeria bacterium]